MTSRRFRRLKKPLLWIRNKIYILFQSIFSQKTTFILPANCFQSKCGKLLPMLASILFSNYFKPTMRPGVFFNSLGTFNKGGYLVKKTSTILNIKYLKDFFVHWYKIKKLDRFTFKKLVFRPTVDRALGHIWFAPPKCYQDLQTLEEIVGLRWLTKDINL